MIVDMKKVSLPADFCRGSVVIVGFGPVGMALATGLRRRGRRVVVFESGGVEAHGFHPESMSTVNGLPFTGAEQRARGLGGNSVLWAGQCMRFSDIDFREREWISGSGWPEAFGRLEDEYATAEQWLRVEGVVGGSSLLRTFNIEPAPLYSRDWELRPSVFNRRSDLMEVYRGAIAADKNLIVVCNATVTDIYRRDGAVTGCQVSAAVGRSSTFDVQQMVLAIGAIEVARFMLTPRPDFPSGIGNEYNQVGTHFQDHPNGPVADVNVDAQQSETLLGMFSVHRHRGMRVLPKLALSAEIQASKKILNAAVMPVFEWNEESLTEELRQLQRAVSGRRFDGSTARNVVRSVKHPQLLARMLRARLQGRVHIEPPSKIRLHIFLEQPPAGDSKISLDFSRLDQFGLPVAKVQWRSGELEERTLTVAVDHARNYFLHRKLGHIGPTYGRAESLLQGGMMKDNQHHAGTTRIGTDPRTSVVDPEMRIHSLSNLYVTGGAVFPSSSFANPTLTMCALAFRLAERLPDPSVNGV